MSAKHVVSDRGAQAAAMERLRERAKCLAEMLSMPSVPPILVAYEIGLIHKAGVECYGKTLIDERMAFAERLNAAALKRDPEDMLQEIEIEDDVEDLMVT